MEENSAEEAETEAAQEIATTSGRLHTHSVFFFGDFLVCTFYIW